MVPRETFTPDRFFDLGDVWFSKLFDGLPYPWEILQKDRKETWIRGNLRATVDKIERNGNIVTRTVSIKVSGGEAVVQAGAYIVGDEIELRSGVEIEAGAWVKGPTILGEGTIVRHGAYIRGGVITGRRAIIGHASEVKSSILLNEAKAPHFAYVGDAILGNGVNLGAGTKVSNLKITNDEIIVRLPEKEIRTSLRKFGAIVGDETETGCNSVLNPGVLLGKKCLVYPGTVVRKNYYSEGSFIR
ncbi:MAG TPA: hypothetical protein VI895_11610 [Bdellovibrionota bacterium]|nr:hypothetical protein [Bdellovibrionota bacterium]